MLHASEEHQPGFRSEVWKCHRGVVPKNGKPAKEDGEDEERQREDGDDDVAEEGLHGFGSTTGRLAGGEINAAWRGGRNWGVQQVDGAVTKEVKKESGQERSVETTCDEKEHDIRLRERERKRERGRG